MHEKHGSVLLPMAIIKERLRLLGHVLRVKNDKCQKFWFLPTISGQEKAVCPCMGFKDAIRKDLKD